MKKNQDFIRSRGGYTLMHMLCYIFVFSMFITLATKLFNTTSRVAAVANTQIARMESYCELNRAFRNTLRSAQGIAQEANGYVSDESTLVLKSMTAQGHSGYIILGQLEDDRHYSVLETWEENGGWKKSYCTTYRLPVAELSFHYDTATPEAARAVTLAYSIRPAPGERATGRKRGKHRVTAALRSINTSTKPGSEGIAL